MTIARSAAIYARISQDASGQRLGVQRQLEDCRRLAESRGWTVAEEYVDNDVSAFSGKTRPSYERMLNDISSGFRDAVIVYHQDRLTRRPMEFEQFAEICQQSGLTLFASVTSDIQLSNDDGLFTARILAAVAAKESSRKAERTKRRIQQKAEAGLPNGGSYRPFGYEADRITVRESEAEVIRGAVERFLARESMQSIVDWFIDQGLPTVGGGEWRSVTIRQIITNPRIAGWRVHNGEIVSKAVWEPLISPDAFTRVTAEHERRRDLGWRPARRHLLSGLLRCGKCGGKLFSSSRSTRRIYKCMSGTDHGGCGGIQVSAAPIEEWIAEAVLLRLDSPSMRAALDGEALEDDRQSALISELRLAQARMEELASMWSGGEISRAEWKAARDPLERRVEVSERQLAQIARTHRLDGLAGNGVALRAGWSTAPLTRQAAIVAAVLDFATVNPSPPRHVMDPNRIVPTWRL